MLLSEPEVLGAGARSHVVRARVVGGEVQSVVLKHFREEPVCGLDDWAGTLFLTRRGIPGSPRFLAGSEEARLFVMEDLGRGQSLDSLFRGDDPQIASSALLSIVRLTAELHVRTLGAQAEYDAVRQAVEPRHERVRIENARYLVDNASRLSRWVEAVGAQEAPGTLADLEQLSRTLADPGPFLAFTHGDMAPSNTVFTRDGPHLVDFEYAGMRHALYDALMWLISVPLPEELSTRADVAYRLVLAQGCEAARVDSEYARACATVVAARTVNVFQWISPKALERDREWAPGFTERNALLHHLERCRLLLEPLNPVPALASTLASLEARLRERWTVEPFVWPALR
ncbi:phosphotransferase [Hyalangium rubrum]|uniref:Phosphotransferase n=1 Tax=Hyalangium rubrum TaxID=3103134 RepID=A0ABU5GXL3_9BACT|nr:phosphotransferase [Hyalangium sp. s54d21]MDY7225932.1 phosphotransferase [Hyalangium sp. s54d21]